MKLLKLFLFIAFYSTTSFALVHEDGEDKSVTAWKVLSPSTKAKVSTHYDRQKSSNVIRLEGEGTKSAFKLDAKLKYDLKEKSDYWLSWDMKYSEDFIIMVILQTNMGKDYLLYTSGDSNSHKQYGLGREFKDGKWHSVRRNLQEDLSYYDNRKYIISFCSFVIRGSGSLDNVATTIHLRHKKVPSQKIPSQELSLEEHPMMPIAKDEKVETETVNNESVNNKTIAKEDSPKINERDETQMVRRTKVKPRRKYNSKLPTIHIVGDNPLYLNIGERYVEQGVTADDKEDGEINVVSIEDIDIRQSGDYSVMYMATDSDGNTAVDIRYVVVGDGSKEKKSTRKKSSQSTQKEQAIREPKREPENIPEEAEQSVDEEILEQREQEISEWERELAERENEIGKKEREMNMIQ